MDDAAEAAPGRSGASAGRGRRREMIAFLLIALFGSPPTTTLDDVSREAQRLAREAARRGATPGGAVDLLRLERLGEWLPPGMVARHLEAAGQDRTRAPLVRAVGWYLLRERALASLDREAARRAQNALGLLDGFVMRAGAAPSPLAAIDPEGWRPYPRGVGAGVLWLDAFLRPARETAAAVATTVEASGGVGVLRLGYDDAVTVWLNGDEIYRAERSHRAWLDQAAVLVRLRPGPNRLMVEVRQREGAWRLLARFTDLAGTPLGVVARPTPWGPPPEPAEGPLLDDFEHLWSSLSAAADADPPVATDLRDLAEYAQRTGLPDDDQSLIRVAMEGAWEADESPETLWAWLQLLDTDERPAVRSGREFVRPVTPAGHFAALRIRLEAAWTHYYAGRTATCLAALKALRTDAPSFTPALRLEAVIDDDLGLPHTAAAHLSRARSQWGDRPALVQAHMAALRAAGMVSALDSGLEAATQRASADPSFIFQLAVLRAAQGQPDTAVALLDRVTSARPELWRYGLEAVSVLRGAGRPEEARAVLETLWRARPGDASVAMALSQVHEAMGALDRGLAALRTALVADPGNPELKARLEITETPAGEKTLGPPVDELIQSHSPEGAMAHVLYHHAQAAVGEDGRAVRRVRRVVRLLNKEGARRYGDIELTYAPGTQRLRINTARLLRAGQAPASPIRSEHALSEPEYRLYYDLRAEVLSFARPRPGDVIELDWTVDDTDPDPAFPGYFGELAYLQETLPRAWSIVEVAGAGAPRLTAVVTAHGVDVRRDGLRFEARNVPGVPYEEAMPGPSGSRAHVHLSTISSWSEVDAAYRRLMAGRDAPTESLAAQASAWVDGADDPETVFRRLYAAVSARLRYVGLEFGIHSFRPELPSVTLARGYGDCKDKATVLIAAARALGHQAHLALVRTRSAGAIGPEPASLAVFDHAVVYVPSLRRFIDPTVDRNDPWTLPPSDHDAVTFVVGMPDAPRRIPAMTAAENLDHRQLDLQLNAAGHFVGQAHWTTRGQPASETRRHLEAEGTRRARLALAWSTGFPGIDVQGLSTKGIAPAFDPVIVEAAVDLGPARALPVGGASWGLVRRFAGSAQRRAPIEIEFRRTETLTLQLAVPDGARVEGPTPTTLKSPFGSFSLAVERTAGRARFTSRFSLEVLRVEPEDYPAFRAWLSAIERRLTWPVEVHHR